MTDKTDPLQQLKQTHLKELRVIAHQLEQYSDKLLSEDDPINIGHRIHDWATLIFARVGEASKILE